jgi:acetyl esterase/lipase
VSPKRLVLILLAAVAALAAAAPAASAYESHLDLPYDLDGRTTPLNRLDLYTPDDAAAGDDRPLVVFVHGGGWMRGDKGNRIAPKAQYFTALGYAFASLNYRLSPDPPDPSDPARIRFPAQPADVGEALGWLDRHARDYGADADQLLLIGHSAGAQLVALVATDPSYVEAQGVKRWQIAGAVSLDTDAFDIAEQATQARNSQNRTTIWNAFATPAEEAADPVWQRASALVAADSKDPPMLLVTSTNPRRLAPNRAFATALGQDPADVLSLTYSHEQFNTGLGTAEGAAETHAVTEFFAAALAGSVPPRVKLTAAPQKRIASGKRSVKVRFRFIARPKGSAGGFECRLDRAPWEHCKSPERRRAKRGSHTFRVRALSHRSRPGPVRSYGFRVVRR